LQQWQQALKTAASDIHELDPDEDSATGPVAAQIEAALAANDWHPLAADRAHGFPMNLLGNEPLAGICEYVASSLIRSDPRNTEPLSFRR
jgi:hypothetical protein